MRPPQDRLTCAWCKKRLADDAEVFTINVKVKPEYDRLAREQAGQIIGFHLFTLGRDVPAIVAGAASQAKKAGKDLMFPACSMACAKALEATLHHEKGLVDPKIS
ncbi:MAG: hypothetical protein HY927_06120 [Elusimicrobia bacterium]|nr:hypothetical protein [Elusimicrobiota bacterium]